MEEYVEDPEYKWEDPKQVDKDDASLWRVITIPKEIEFINQKLVRCLYSECMVHVWCMYGTFFGYVWYKLFLLW